MHSAYKPPRRRDPGPLLDQLPPTSTSDSEPPEISAKPGRLDGEIALVTTLDDEPGPHAVVHTPTKAIHCADRLDTERTERRMGSWTPSRREQALIHYAIDGAYDELAEDHDTPLCYILDQIEDAQSTRSATQEDIWANRDAGVVTHG